MRDVIQSMWIGPRLSSMEQLCIRSFLAHGHPFHLYVYDEVANVPDGTDVRPAQEILPREAIFTYRKGRGKGNPSAFSNLFRYTLLHQRGGWWADLDAVCMRPLEFDQEHVLGNEREPDGTLHVAIGLFKAPAGSPLLAHCRRLVQQVDKSKARWGQFGPRLVHRAIAELGLPINYLPPEAFYPVDYWDVRRLVRGGEVPGDCHSIHLWNSQWRQERLNPDAPYDDGSLYEQLRRRYLPDGWKDDPVPRQAVASRPGGLAVLGDWWRRLVSGKRVRQRDAA